MKKNTKFLLKLICALACASFVCTFSSCATKSFSETRDKVTTKLYKKGKTIRIACASSWEVNDSLQWQGLELAQQEINDAGGVHGAKIELIKTDDKKDKKEALYVAYEIATRPDITALIGHSTSGYSVPASQVYNYYKLLMFSPMSTAQKLTARGFDDVFRNIPKASVFAKAAATLCKDHDWNRILIYYIDTEYGEDIANAFELACSKIEVSIVERDSYSPIDSKKFFTAKAKFWNAKFDYDAIFLAGSMPQLQSVIEAIRGIGIKQPIVGTDAFDYPELTSWIVANNVRDIYAVSSFDINSNLEEFIKFKDNFIRTYETEPDQEAAQAYEALKTIAKAIDISDSVKNEDIINTLKANTWSGIIGNEYRFDNRGDVLGVRMHTIDYNSIIDERMKDKMAKQKEKSKENK